MIRRPLLARWGRDPRVAPAPETRRGRRVPLADLASNTPRRVRATPLARGTDAGPSLLRLPAFALLGAVRVYQRFISPAMPVITLGGCACRFTPTCSHYAAEAIATHGAVVGTWLALKRLAKCTPLHPGGFDPVPERRARPVCRSAAA